MRLALVATLIVAGSVSASLAAPLTPEACELIDRKLFSAKLMSNPHAALDFCREAAAKAAEFDRDPFYGGAIARCMAYSEKHLENRRAACRLHARALRLLRSVRAHHPQHTRAIGLISTLRRDRSWFGCSN